MNLIGVMSCLETTERIKFAEKVQLNTLSFEKFVFYVDGL